MAHNHPEPPPWPSGPHRLRIPNAAGGPRYLTAGLADDAPVTVQPLASESPLREQQVVSVLSSLPR